MSFSMPIFVAAVMFINWALHTAAVVGDDVASRAAEAKELYEQSRFEEALRLYRDAQLERPQSAPLHFNIGDALAKVGHTEEALKEFERAAALSSDPQLTADSFFNMGKTLFQQQNFAPAVEVFKQVLEIDAEDIQAKLHLELAQEKLEEQQQQQQQQQQRQDEEKDESREEEDQTEPPEEERRNQPQEEEDKRRESEREQPTENQEKEVAESEKEALNREEAERLLDALQDREKKLLLQRIIEVERPPQDKDW